MAGRLAIERFQLTGLAPRDHPAPDRLKAVIDRVDARRLTRRIAAALGDYGADDGRVIVLRRLDLALAETRIDDVDRLARQLAEGVAAAVARLSTMHATDSIAVFASAGAQLAAFVAAVARGDAWGRWWFSDFECLKMLPASSAIRAAMLRNPVAGCTALGAIAEVDRMRIATTLSAIDADLLIEGLAPMLADEADEAIWGQVFALPSLPRELPFSVAIVHDLALLAAGAAGPLPRAAVDALRLRAVLVRTVPHEDLAAMIRLGSGKALAAAAVDLAASDLAPLLALPSNIRGRIADALTADPEPVPVPAFTRFGGLLLLWPHLPQIEAGSLPDGPGDKRGLIALIALASLFGRTGSTAALNDSVLRNAFDVDLRADLAQLADWLGAVRPSALPPPLLSSRDAGLPLPFRNHPRQARAVKALGLAALADFARRLPGFAGASLKFMRANMIGVGAHVLVTQDCVHAIVDRPPLDVLLSISGLADRSVDLGERRLLLERAP